jgi:hypothetical protein
VLPNKSLLDQGGALRAPQAGPACRSAHGGPALQCLHRALRSDLRTAPTAAHRAVRHLLIRALAEGSRYPSRSFAFPAHPSLGLRRSRLRPARQIITGWAASRSYRCSARPAAPATAPASVLTARNESTTVISSSHGNFSNPATIQDHHSLQHDGHAPTHRDQLKPEYLLAGPSAKSRGLVVCTDRMNSNISQIRSTTESYGRFGLEPFLPLGSHANLHRRNT